MKVKSITLQNFRSFSDATSFDLSQLNVLIGANNSGKSSVLRGLAAMQETSETGPADVRVGSTSASIIIDLEALLPAWSEGPVGKLAIAISSPDRQSGGTQIVMHYPSGSTIVGMLTAVEPNHFIVPYLSKRKVMTFAEDVRSQLAMRVFNTMTHLAARLSMVSNQYHPRNRQYSEACEAILGFVVTCIPSANGQQPGIYLPNSETLPIGQLGEGVPNIVSLLAELAISEEKLFLIEEPENDLHPIALKALLDLIVASSERNQFVISTHSNIVLSHLGGIPDANVYEISTVPKKLPTEAIVKKIERSPEARLAVLRSLGYTLSDFDLWDGWLFLEEASAERLIRDYLVPWFVPSLARVRTVSAGGAGNVEPSVQDFYRLVRFTHLESVYRDATWVRVDGDDAGKLAIAKLTESFPSWERGRFDTFTQPNFENYYPAVFKERILEVLAIQDRQTKRASKKELLNAVLQWIKEDLDRAKTALEHSAADVISELRRIATHLK